MTRRLNLPKIGGPERLTYSSPAAHDEGRRYERRQIAKALREYGNLIAPDKCDGHEKCVSCTIDALADEIDPEDG